MIRYMIAVWLALTPYAYAVQPSPGETTVCGVANLTAGVASSNVVLPNVTSGSACSTVFVFNAGAVTAYVSNGGSSVTATTASIPVLAGHGIGFTLANGSTYVAGITASSTAALTIYQAEGAVNFK